MSNDTEPVGSPSHGVKHGNLRAWAFIIAGMLMVFAVASFAINHA